MSRIGKKPIAVPASVKVEVAGGRVSVKGPAGELTLNVHPTMSVSFADAVISVSRPDDKRSSRALHGLTDRKSVV